VADGVANGQAGNLCAPLLDTVTEAIHPSANADCGEDIPGSTSEVLQASPSIPRGL